MSTTSNIIAGVTLTSALVVGGIALSPDASDVAPDGGVADAGQQPLVGNFYLRFPDEATFRREVRSTDFWQWEYATVDAGVDDAGNAHHKQVQLDSGTLIMANMGHAFDLVGTITLTDADGGSEVLEGWHVNFSGILPNEWRQHIVEPENPVRRMR